MSEQEKSDGLLIGILVAMVLLVLVAAGVFGLGFVRMSRALEVERRAAEAARRDALLERDQAEAARAAAEAMLAAQKALEGQSTGQAAGSETSQAGESERVKEDNQ